MKSATSINTGSVLKWNSINYIVNLGSKFLFTVVLQRLLEPADFGVVASILVFTGIAQVIVDNGFQSAIVQSNQIERQAVSTVFYINIIIGAFCTGALFLAAPAVASFFGSPRITPIAQVLSLVYLFQSASLVQRALLVREHAFKKVAFIEIGANLLAGIAAIIYAIYYGGVWSLVVLILGQAILSSIFFWIQPGSYRPGFIFQLKSVARLWKFGSRVFLNGLFIYLNSRIDLLMTGKYLGDTLQGLYARGKDYGLLPSGVLIGIVSKSYFPVFSRLQDDSTKLRSSYLTALRTMALLSAFLFPLIYLCVGEAILLVLGVKWEGMIRVTEWFIVLSSLYVFNSINANLLAGIGRPGRNLLIQMIVGSLRLLAVFLYFIFSVDVDLEIIVGILILFGLIENQFSFFYVNKEKGFGLIEMMRQTYFILLPAWSIALILRYLLIPQLETILPSVAAVISVVLIFLFALFMLLRMMGMKFSLKSLLGTAKGRVN